MITVHVLQIMIVVVVKLVMLTVKLVTDLTILNVIFVLKASLLNQTLLLPVSVPVQVDIGLIPYLELVLLVIIHVLPVLVKELNLKVMPVCVLLVLITGDYTLIFVTNHVHPVCLWKMVSVKLVTLLV